MEDITTTSEVSAVPAALLPAPTWRERIYEYWRRSVVYILGYIKKPVVYLTVIGSLLLLLTIVAVLYFVRGSQEPVMQFTQVYSFVPEKVSASAPIQITLPDGITEEVAKTAITFSPRLTGAWQEESVDGVLFFKSDKPLRVGFHYAVNLDSPEAQISGDFYADVDPDIEAIFPMLGSESDEATEITIVFNRPMVPLTTLTELESQTVPVSITPETKGTFKWISTRTLQFVPETTLLPASNYVVEIKNGFTSLDGISVPPKTHTFSTRPLRYVGGELDTVSFKMPIVVAFNQPVDLEATARKIKVTTGTNSEVPVVVEYGTKTYIQAKTKKEVVETDLSTLYIYQKNDRHNRSKLWDFDTVYNVTVEGAVPQSGMNELTESKRFSVSVPSVLQSVVARSDRSDLVSQALFDPQGVLELHSYEPVDISKSRITAPGLESVVYGEKCVGDDPSDWGYDESSCVKEDDTRTLKLTFNESAYTRGQQTSVVLDRVVTIDGYTVNAEPLLVPVTMYPELQIVSINPRDTNTSAPVDGMVLCTNTPLQDPKEGGVKSYVTTSGYIVYGRWSPSIFVETAESNYYQCAVGQYQTTLKYGLHPETDYTLALTITDAFGQKRDQSVSFKTATAPDFYTRINNLQQQYNVTTPDKTTFTYSAENLEFVTMHICKMSPELFLERSIDRAAPDTPATSVGCSAVIEKQIPLPARYWVNNYFQIELSEYFTDTRGQYIVTLTHPKFTDGYSKKQIYDRTYISVTNLAVGKKEIEYTDDMWSMSTNPHNLDTLHKTLNSEYNLYWVNNANTLQPVLGAQVTQYTGSRDSSFARSTAGFSDGEGIAFAAVDQNIAGAVVVSGLDTAVVVDWSDTLEYAAPAQDASRTYMYTDRPIYRPGHEVHIRGIDRIGFDGVYEVWAGEETDLEIFDATGESIYTTKVTPSSYGTFAANFTLPNDASLGTYRIEMFGHSAFFDVEEYVPAAFKLSATPTKDEYINGDTLELEVDAGYYFGVPVAEGSVTYSVTAQDYYFDRYTDEWFNFGSDWYYCYSCGYGDDFLFRGEAVLNGDGKATISRKLDLEQFFTKPEDRSSKLVNITLTAKDQNGRSVSTQTSFVLHQSDVYLGAKFDEYYTSMNTPVTLSVKTVDTKGVGVGVRGIQQTLYKVEWETMKRQEVDGGYYYHSEKKRTKVSEDTLNTDSSGSWKGQMNFTDEGQYEVDVQYTDSRGMTIKTVSSLYIYGTDTVVIPPNNNYSLEVESNKTDVEVGETASVLIKSPYPKAKALVTLERGRVYDYDVVDVVGGLYEYTFKVTEEYSPNVQLSVLLLAPEPAVKYGSIPFTVGRDAHVLNVSVTAGKQHYLPGEEVVLQIQTTDATGRAVPAEVSVAVADLSVLALKGNPKKDPLVFFYDGFPIAVTTASNIKYILHEVDIPTGTKGGGGGDPEDLATKKRGTFKDTAFWSAQVQTDASGYAQVRFTLPDNLTTWQVESVGVTQDTKLGVSYNEFTTKKDLMAVPLRPRFVVPGDTFNIGATVFNQTEETRTINVSVSSETLAFTGAREDSVTVPKGESRTVYFPVTAPETKQSGSHQFTFSAVSDQLADVVDQTIAITKNNTYETVATANYTTDVKTTEYLYIPKEVISGQGGLTIHANATLAVFMTDALEYMVDYPYGCSEQLASSLTTIATIVRAQNVSGVSATTTQVTVDAQSRNVSEIVTEGLARLYEAQTVAGGFSYYAGLSNDLPLTLHVIEALTALKAAGYEVREDVLRRAVAYAASATKQKYYANPEENKDTVIITQYILQSAIPNRTSEFTDIIASLLKDDEYINETISSLALGYLALVVESGYPKSDRNHVYTELQDRIVIDGRGAHIEYSAHPSWQHYESAERNTALLLQVFTAYQDEHSQLANVLRWILASRSREGVWGSTVTTYSVVHAMVEYMEWRQETKANFVLHGTLSGNELFTFDVNPDTIFGTFTHVVPIDALARNVLTPLSFVIENRGSTEPTLYYDMALKYFLPARSLPPRDEGITITRGLYSYDAQDVDVPVTDIAVGDVVKGKITITIPQTSHHVTLEDFIPAGFEIVNFNLATEDTSLTESEDGSNEYEPEYWYEASATTDQGESWWDTITGLFGTSNTAQVYRPYTKNTRMTTKHILRPTHAETHDDRVFLYTERLEPGVYEYEYYLRALVPGTYTHLPARVEEQYFPEIFGRTSGGVVTITE